MPVIRAIVERHLEEAATLWPLRDRAALSPGYARSELAELDERIEAHLDGLRVGGDESWAVVAEALAYEEAGEVFAAAQLALATQELEALAPVLDKAGSEASLRRGLVAALAWTPVAQLEPALAALLDRHSPPPLLFLGIAGATAHGRDPGLVLSYALETTHAPLRARALRAAGQLGRVDLLDAVRAAATDASPEIRFWAAWAATLLGDRSLLTTLWDLGASDFEDADRALWLAARASEPRAAIAELLSLRAREERARSAVLGFGVVGDASALAHVLDAMTVQDLARTAGTAFTMITGLPITGALEADPPDGFHDGPTDDPDDDDVSLPPDIDLPWPDPAACARVSGNITGRVLAGKPIEPAWLADLVSADVSQAIRHAAALENALREPRAPLYDVRARS